MSDAVSLEVLIQIRDELAGLNRARAGMQGAKKDANELGNAIKQGLGIGTGMQLVTSGVALLKQTLSATVGDAFRLATEVKNSANAINAAVEPYQVIKDLVEDTGGDMASVALASKNMSEQIIKAGRGGSESLNALNLTAAELVKLPLEGKLEAVARAAFLAEDRESALAAASEVLGSKNLPKLTNALRVLATDGYAKVAKEAKEAGQVMSPEAIERLHKAQLAIANLKDEVTVGVGEAINYGGSLIESAKKDFWSTTGNFLLAGMNPYFAGDLAMTMAKNVPKPPAAPTPPPPPPPRATEEALLQARLGAVEWKAGQFQGNPLLSETQQRQAIIGVMREQEEILQRLIKLNYSDVDIKLPEKGATEEELQRWRERVELEQKLSGVRQQRMQAVDTPMMALLREMDDTTALINNSLATTTRSIVSGLGSDIWEAMKGTQAWGQAWVGMGDIAGRMLTQIVTQMLVIKALNLALGIFGFGITGNAGMGIGKVGAATAVPTAMPTVTNAGGGSWFTSGPTKLIVGDNPGGIEHIQVTPISGVGRSTVNGRTVQMGGGGSLIARGSGSDRPSILVNQTLNISTGVAETVRREMMEMMPAFRELAVDATREAAARGDA